MQFLAILARGLLLALLLPAAYAESLKSIVVLDFELIDETEDKASIPAQQARLVMISEQLRAELGERKLYQVVDPKPVAEMIASAKAGQNLYACNGCELEIARKLGAERVLTGWVQKVSNLILNLNVEIKNAESGETVLKKSVDLRGNTDASWRRAVSYMVRDMVEKRQGGR